MVEDSSPVPEGSPVEEYREKKGNRSALEKVSMLVPNLTDETTVATVAADADVSKETARKYLHHFENWNLLVRTGTDPETFVRNESYFEWLRVDTLKQDNSVDELQNELSELAAEDERLSAELGADSPATADLLGEGYASADERAEKVRRWQSIRDRMNDVITALQNKLDIESGAANDGTAERPRITE
jgi:hypothetical protein